MDETLQESSRFTRFGMSSPPALGGQPGDYEERWSQWFLEQSFFRDFVYRNPQGKKKGTELADALVLCGDVALLVQVKAQKGKHEPVAWATEKLLGEAACTPLRPPWCTACGTLGACARKTGQTHSRGLLSDRSRRGTGAGMAFEPPLAGGS